MEEQKKQGHKGKGAEVQVPSGDAVHSEKC